MRSCMCRLPSSFEVREPQIKEFFWGNNAVRLTAKNRTDSVRTAGIHVQTNHVKGAEVGGMGWQDEVAFHPGERKGARLWI